MPVCGRRNLTPVSVLPTWECANRAPARPARRAGARAPAADRAVIVAPRVMPKKLPACSRPSGEPVRPAAGQLLPDTHQRRSARGSRTSCEVDWEERRCLETDEVTVFKMGSTPDARRVESTQLCLPLCRVWKGLTSVHAALVTLMRMRRWLGREAPTHGRRKERPFCFC